MENHLALLRRCVALSWLARQGGNTPFGALLADSEGRILLEQGNIELTEKVCTGHAETALMAAASRLYDKAFLWTCTLYTTVEPCAMCTGAAYWGNVGRIVYALDEHRLAELTGDSEVNPTLALPCREVLARGRKPVAVQGPFSDLEDEVVEAHRGYW
jgi:tRNA(Arg) A34 adenosine deaminase TadA